MYTITVTAAHLIVISFTIGAIAGALMMLLVLMQAGLSGRNKKPIDKP